MVDATQLFLAARDECVERLGNRGVELRPLVDLERCLPDLGRPVRRGGPAGELPVLIVLPIRDERLVERRLVTGKRVRRAEEMTAGRDAGDGLQARGDLLGVNVDR